MQSKFVDLLWSEQPDAYLSVWAKKSNSTAFFKLSDIDQAEAYMTSLGGVDDVYFTVGLLRQPPRSGRGTASDIAYIPAFHMDFDIAPQGDNVHAKSALPGTLDELLAFLSEIDAPKPTVLVNSGNGIHGYWGFEQPLHIPDADQREKVAGQLKDFQKSIIELARIRRGWNFDFTGDLARVLRWPGTFNHKTRPPRPVEIAHCNPEARYSEREISVWVGERMKEIAPDTRKRPMRDRKKHEGTGDLPDFESVRAGCLFIERCTSSARMPEPEWYAFASIAGRCKDGRAIFHEVSAQDERYNEQETEAKLLHSLDAAGPRTCANIAEELNREGCRNCPFFRKVRSPISLGQLPPQLVKLMRENVFINSLRTYLDLQTGTMLTSPAFSDKFRHLTGNTAPHHALSSHHLTRKVDAMEYRPGIPDRFIELEAGISAVNIWKDDGLRPQEGDCATLRAHIELLIPDEVFREHFLNCIAFLLQRPGEKIAHAILITGAQGTGKSLLFGLLRRLVGPSNHRSIESEQLMSRFMAQMANVRLATIEELKTFERLEVYNRLKTWITERTNRVEEKHIPYYEARTPDLIIGTSNHEAPINLEVGDRRFAYYISPMKPQSAEYYDNLVEAIEHEASAFAGWLMSRDISRFSPGARPPETEAKAELVKWSRPLVQQELEAMMQENAYPFFGDLVSLNDVQSELKERLCRMPSQVEVSAALRAFGAVNLNRPVRLTDDQRGLQVRVWAWRNTEYWMGAEMSQLREYYSYRKRHEEN